MEQLWNHADYTSAGIVFSGAKKLASSQVAPLVAQARGYRTVSEATDATAVAKKVVTGQERKAANRLKQMVRDGDDFLVIPWFRVDEVFSDGLAVEPRAIQVRPSTPLPNPKGKPAKYEILAGHSSVLDFHPSLSSDFIYGTHRFLITEGVIKGDSALTAQLLGAGATKEDLQLTEDEQSARKLVREYLEAMPKRLRVPILSLIGVGNWHANPEWNTIVLRDRDILVAFDGDLRQNRMVWNQAYKLFEFIDSKRGVPHLLDLGGVKAEKDKLTSGFSANEKLGLDDYLAHVGTFADALELVEHTLPAQPQRMFEAKPGDVQISSDGSCVVEYVKQTSFSGAPAYAWEERVFLGGRIKKVSSLRVLADVSVRDGSISSGAVIESAKGDCTIEISWQNEQTNEIVSRDVVGPRVILEAPPSEWSKRGAIIHTDILRHPAWPPRAKDGELFLRAIKSNRIEDQEILEGWDTMGYVPTDSGTPVFLVGEQSLGSSQKDESENRPGVTEEVMPMASSYGVNDTFWSLSIAEWRKQVQKDIRCVLDAFLVDSAWTNPAIGAIVLSCALRPTVPGTTSINLFVSGAPGAGKTYLASFLMGFWAKKAGTWTVNNLPGQANDTQAAREHSVARTPIYVIDDLAPNVSKAAAERQEGGIDEAIRSKFNVAGKRRGNADGTQRFVHHPRALQVFTAENRRDTLSIQQRMIGIHLASRRQINSPRAEHIESLTKHPQNPLSRLTAAMVRLWLNVDLHETPLSDIPVHDWKHKYDLAQDAMRKAKIEIQTQLNTAFGVHTGTSARRAGMFAELFFTLDALYALAVWAGIHSSDPCLEVLDRTSPTSVHSAMIAAAAFDLADFREKANSKNLLEAIRSLFEGGRAHLESAHSAGQRPFLVGSDAEAKNRACGWRVDPKTGEWVPFGTPIGYAGVPAGSSEEIALFSAVNAFNLAQREHPSLVPPGQKSADAWSQVWEDEDGALTHPGYTRNIVENKNTVQMRAGGDRIRGVPVRFSAIFDENTEN